MSARVLLRAIAGNLYFDSHCHSLWFGNTFCVALCIKYVNWEYHNNDQSVGVIPKWDLGILGLQISQSRIPGLRIQSLICVSAHYKRVMMMTVSTWMGVCPWAGKPSRYIAITKFNSAFHHSIPG